MMLCSTGYYCAAYESITRLPCLLFSDEGWLSIVEHCTIDSSIKAATKLKTCVELPKPGITIAQMGLRRQDYAKLVHAAC